jgi:hypothetical protein
MTVREMVKQRRAAFMPELLINEKTVSLQTSYDTEHRLFKFDRTFNLGPDQPKSDPWQTIRIVNVGLGSAKRIQAKWTINVDKLAKEINKIASKCSIDARFKYDAGHGHLSIDGKEIHSIIHMVDNQVWQKWDYLLPASVDQQGLELRIPPFLIDSYLFAMTAAFKAESHSGGFEILPILSRADLAVEYSDIQNNSYKKRFKFELDMTYGDKKAATETDKSESYVFSGMFKATENH